MYGIVALEVRRSPFRFFVPVLLLAEFAMLFGRQTAWIGVWPQAGAAVSTSALVTGPLSAGAAAWIGARWVNIGLRDQVLAGTRSWWRPQSGLVASILTYAVGAYAIGALAAEAISWNAAGPGVIWPGYVLLGLTTVVSSVGLGVLAGTVFPSRFFTPIAATLAMYIFQGLRHLPIDGPVFLQIQALPLAANLFFAALVLVAAVLVRPRAFEAHRTVRNHVLAVGSVLGIALSFAATQALGVVQAARMPPATLTCAGTPKVCVWPEDVTYLPALENAAARLAATTPDVLHAPSAYYEHGLRPQQEQNGNAFRLPPLWFAVGDMATTSLYASMSPFCLPTDQSQLDDWTRAYQEASEWLSRVAIGGPRPADIGGGPPLVNQGELDALLTRPAAEQDNWLRERLTLIAEYHCA